YYLLFPGGDLLSSPMKRALPLFALFACAPPPAPPPAPQPLPPDGLYVALRPELGALSVVDVAGETFERQVLASTLQGAVTRARARVYLLDGDLSTGPRPWEESSERGSSEFWLQWYGDALGVKTEWRGRVDALVQRFAGEVKGYYLASSAEPWTL